MEGIQVVQVCRGKLTAGDNPTKTLKVGEIMEASIYSNTKYTTCRASSLKVARALQYSVSIPSLTRSG